MQRAAPESSVTLPTFVPPVFAQPPVPICGSPVVKESWLKQQQLQPPVGAVLVVVVPVEVVVVVPGTEVVVVPGTEVVVVGGGAPGHEPGAGALPAMKRPGSSRLTKPSPKLAQ